MNTSACRIIDLSPDPSKLNTATSKGQIDLAFLFFSLEVLKTKFPNMIPVTKAGKDGSIDAWQEDNGERIFLEAKFIGSGNFDDAKKRWYEVRSRLDRNLTPHKPKQSQYKPWYETNPVVKKYLFCHSSRCTLVKRDELRKEISSFFQEELALRKNLEHLNQIEIVPISWDELLNEMMNAPYLRFRWFPSNQLDKLELLDYRPPCTSSFQRFQNSEYLPYYSRKQHLLNYKSNEPDEEMLIEMISVKNPGLIITGAGGVGKTRLALEIGRIASSSKYDWVVFKSRRQLSVQDLRQTLSIVGNADVLLIIDYIEEQPNFNELIDYIAETNDNILSLKVAYVATCRSAYYLSRLSMNERHEVLDLSPPKTTERGIWHNEFRIACVIKIISEAGLLDDRRAQKLCRDHIVLATFLLFLKKNNKLPELEKLLNEQDFGNWMARNIKSSFPEGLSGMQQIKRWLALSLPLFPMNSETYRKLRSISTDEIRSWFDRLHIDGWIEEFDKERFSTWYTLHDVFADQILLEYVSLGGKSFVDDLIDSAEKIENIESLIVSLQRVANDAIFPSINWRELLSQRYKLKPELWSKSRVAITESSLINDEDLATLMKKDIEFWDGLERNIPFQWALSKRIKSATSSVEISDAKLNEFWGEYLLRFDASYIKSALLVAMGLRLNKNAFIEIALNWISPRKTNLWTDYVYTEWCNLGLPLADITEPLSAWLQFNAGHYFASFTIKAWLKAGGDISIIKKPIEIWLDKHGKEREAYFIFRTWMNANGCLDTIEKPLEGWLNIHCESSFRARFLFTSWIESGGMLSILESSLKKWIENYGDTIETQFVFKSWLLKNGPLEIVNDPIKKWFKIYDKDIQAQYVISSWLDAGGSPELIEMALINWMEIHGESLDAQFVIFSWLKAGGGRKILLKYIKNWLKIHSCTEDARFVISSWLDAGGEIELVADSFEKWLPLFGTMPEASFVLNSWLKNKGDMNLVRTPIKKWFEANTVSKYAPYIIQAWLDAKGPTDERQKDIKQWLEFHNTLPEAQFIFVSWLNANGSHNFIKDHINEWLKVNKKLCEAHFVICAWLEAKGSPVFVQQYLYDWLKENGRLIEASFIYEAWFNAKRSFSDVENYLFVWLSLHGNSPEAQFVYTSLLSMKAQLQFDEKFVHEWLKQFAKNLPETIFVLAAWIDSKRSIHSVERPVKEWLATFGYTPEAQFLYKSWLDAKGSPHKIKKDIKRWLLKNETQFEASFVYKSWLDAKGSIKIVEPHIELWLQKYSSTSDAFFVLSSWLNASGSIYSVKKYVHECLSIHGKNYGAHFVIVSWLNAKGSIKEIKKYTEKWLERHCRTKGASFVFRACVRREVKGKKIRTFMNQWLNQYKREKDAGFVISIALKSNYYSKIDDRVIEEWLKHFGLIENAGAVYLNLFKERRLKKKYEKKLKIWIAKYPRSHWCSKIIKTIKKEKYKSSLKHIEN